MIDVEDYIFNAVYDEVAPLCAKNAFRSDEKPVPTKFPAVLLFEKSNLTDTDMNSNQLADDYAILMYEAHVAAMTKREARDVFNALDGALQKLNMSRISWDFAPGSANVDVQEIVARYRVKVDGNGVLYRYT